MICLLSLFSIQEIFILKEVEQIQSTRPKSSLIKICPKLMVQFPKIITNFINKFTIEITIFIGKVKFWVPLMLNNNANLNLARATGSTGRSGG